MSDTPLTSTPDETIICRVTPWFFRRMGILAAMLLGMGGYFFYDGKIGYPKKNEIAEKKVWFEKVYVASFDEAKQAQRLEEWIAKAKVEGLPTGENGEPPKWATYAARNGWPEEAKRYSPEDIEQQFWWAGAMALGGLGVLIKLLLDRGKTFVGQADHMIMPNGATVRFADAFRVDKRKWDVKALAYVHYRENNIEKRAVVDDLKFDGAGKVLERLLANFKGELIEKAPDEEPEAEKAGD
jgi:hypothetical protein